MPIFTITIDGKEEVISAKRLFTNRVWDDQEPGFIRWITSSADTLGAYYPGPGSFGVNTSGYCIESEKLVYI